MDTSNVKLNYATVKLIDVADWDNFVKEIYGKPYSFQQQGGCKERGIESFILPDDFCWDYESPNIPFGGMGVSFEAWLNTPVETYEEMFWERNFYPCHLMIANDLYDRGILEAGEYVINIDW
jgi:hypothetical protein